MRPYQQQALAELSAAATRCRSIVYVLPTGGGKTVIAAELARRAAEKGNRTLFLVHRRELLRQAVETLETAVPGAFIGVEAAGRPSVPWAPLHVGMVQSIARRNNDVRPDIVIIDEAHHARAATWERVLARWPDAWRIGLTATPERLDGKGLRAHFDHMILGPSIRDLVRDGYLAPTRVMAPYGAMDLDGVRLNKSGEYRADEVAERVTEKTIAAAAINYHRHAPGRPAIFFGVHTEHSRRVAAELATLGYRAAHVDGNDPAARRDRVMNDLKTGALDVVCNCDLISEGFDAPGCEVVIMGAPTNSVTRYLQMAGRAMRPAPGKTALVLDLAGNAYLHDDPDQPREWSLDDGAGEQRKSGPLRPKKCEGVCCLNCAPPRAPLICPQCRRRSEAENCSHGCGVCPKCGTRAGGPVCALCGAARNPTPAAPAGKCRAWYTGPKCRCCGWRNPLPEVNEADVPLADTRGGRPTAPPGRPRINRRELNRLIWEARQRPDRAGAIHALARELGYRPGWADHILRAWAESDHWRRRAR